MFDHFQFDRDVLHSVAGGRSAIDIPRLSIHTPEAARSFIASYGFDLTSPGTEQKLWDYHRRALVLMIEKLGFSESQIPERLRDRKSLQDISRLLIYASSRDPDEKEMQRWACAFLRCMHVFVHAENDLFSSFSEEIQSQILTPFQQAIRHDGSQHRPVLKSSSAGRNEIELLSFDVKPLKTSSSTVIKLLARPEALAMKVFDRLGVRFVTRSIFDSFQVIRFLVEENLISFPHIMPDQSSNNLYPVDLFFQLCEKFKGKSEEQIVEFLKNGKNEKTASPSPSSDKSPAARSVEISKELEKYFESQLKESKGQEQMFRKPNEQSSLQFRFIKFITRKLIQIQGPGRESFCFFFPFEVQILDQDSMDQASQGPSEHEAYKERQKAKARGRLFPDEGASS